MACVCSMYIHATCTICSYSLVRQPSCQQRFVGFLFSCKGDHSRISHVYTNGSTQFMPFSFLYFSTPLPSPFSLPSSPSFSFSFVLPFLPLQILLLTLRLSIPSVLRFSICAGILYIAFMFLGWLVLGPYHTKVSGGVAGGVPLWVWV